MPRVTVTTTPVKIAPDNWQRKSLTIQNTDGAGVLTIGDTLVAPSGLNLYPYGSVTYSRDTGDNPTLARYGVSDIVGGIVVVYSEEF